MKNATVKSILVLGGICLGASLLLGVTNLVTGPVIRAAEEEAANSALSEVMPAGGSFVKTALPNGTPATVTDVWQASSGGYVFRLSAAGYAPGIIIMCGIGPDGVITGVKTVSSSETAGYGKQCEEEWYQTQYTGQDGTLSGVDNISGATKTSNGYRGAIRDAFTAFALYSGSEAVRPTEELLAELYPAGGEATLLKTAAPLPTGVQRVYRFTDGAYGFAVTAEDGERLAVLSPAGEVLADGGVPSADALRDALTAILRAEDDAAVAAVLPDAAGYEKLETEPDSALTDTVRLHAAYRTSEGVYVIVVLSDGYSVHREGEAGVPMTLSVAIAPDGRIAGTAVLSHKESPQYGQSQIIENKTYTDRYVGADETGISAVRPDAEAYATYTASGYQNGVRAAFSVFDALTAPADHD